MIPQVQRLLRWKMWLWPPRVITATILNRMGVRYSHTIDPRTGRPITHSLASVTVLANLCRSRCLGNSLMVLGEEQGMALAEQLKSAECICW